MSKCILVLSASVGAGHLRAAQAVALALRELDPTAMVEQLDVLTLTNAVFRRLYGKAYLDLVNHAPHTLGYFYDLMDRPVSAERKSDQLRYLVEKLNLTAFLKSQHLQGDRPVVLLLSGGFGVGPVDQLLAQVLGVGTPVEVVVVAGRNEELRRRLAMVTPPARHRLVVVGYTEKMDELMTVADVVVSKPGGLTTSEALACGAAMAVVNPIPGQESRNSDFLLENGAALKINNLATLPFKLDKVLADPKRLAQLKRNAKRLGRPRAAFEVARLALEWATSRHN